MRVLYIEANPSDCENFQKTAAAFGVTVDVVHSGRAGLEAWADVDYDIVTTGCHLFDQSGLDVARQILDKNPEQPVFLVIRKSHMKQAVDLMPLGVVSFVIQEEGISWHETLEGYFINLQSRSAKRRNHLAAEVALRKSEQRLQDFADSGSDWQWETDTRGVIIWQSATADEISGYTVTSALGMTREEIAGDLYVADEWADYRQAIEEQTAIVSFEFSYITDEGDKRTVVINGKALFDDDGMFVGHRGAASDITLRKKTEADLNKALVDAEQANRAKSEFLATMSHEFRTPLNAILGFSEMLRAQYLGPLGVKNYEEYANDIHLSGEHLLALINDILDISAIEAGKRVMTPESITIRDLIYDCVHNMEKLARDKGVEVLQDIPDDLPLVQADKRSLIQIIYNILSNALKFTNEGGIVQIIASQQDDEILLQIEDSGIGISASDLANITQPFAQVNSDPHNVREGTGLGLSIVKSLVEAHGGKLDIVSVVGTGTTVRIHIPTGGA